MHKSLVVSILAGLATLPAMGALLVQAPSPMTQVSPAGAGMSHINVGWDEDTSALTTHVDFQPVVLQPLSVWRPADSFDPSSPWYALLDPTQGAAIFNSQYGLLADTASLPASLLGSRFLVSVVAGSASAGLDIYRSSYTGASQVFEPVLGTTGSSAEMQWTGTMMHPLFVMPAGSSGAAAVTLRFTITDSSYVPLVGYAPVDATVAFQAIPEPTLVSFAPLALGMLIIRRRRKGL